MKILKGLCLACVMLFFVGKSEAQPKHTFEIKNGDFYYDSKPIKIYSGEVHYSRIPKEYWRHRFQMLKAMGLNAVTTYVFWNYHNMDPGVWDFKSENRDLASFIKIAGEEGLMVILRPGPYTCAEWEFGGYPWWLQKNKDLVIRGKNQPFLDSCNVYINKLAEQVKNLQITHGGPVIMIQAENEFGSYVAQRKDIPLAEHKAYSHSILEMLKKAGFDVPFFTSDGSWLFEGGVIEGALPTANGEYNIENLIKVVDQYNGGKGPYMVAEFYPGWLDHWGEEFIRGNVQDNAKQAEKYLEKNISFNFYMAHGGTNFGFTAGANYNDEKDIQPDITSYDYDAPITEAGWIGRSYMAIREVMEKHVKYPIPEIPAPIPVIEIPNIPLTKSIDFLDLKKNTDPIQNAQPLSFEDLNQGYGYVLYSKRFTQPISGKLSIPGLRDYATVYVNGKKIGELNRIYKKYEIDVDIPFNATLDILVENMGRINYGAKITENTKGIISPISINDFEIAGGWNMYLFPYSTPMATDKEATGNRPGRPVVYTGSFQLAKTGDTFLDMSQWGKGIVFINGHHLGRYWKIGPQQTLYVPGCWLNKGKNEIQIFEQLNDTQQTKVSGVKTPILDKLNP